MDESASVAEGGEEVEGEENEAPKVVDSVVAAKKETKEDGEGRHTEETFVNLSESAGDEEVTTGWRLGE